MLQGMHDLVITFLAIVVPGHFYIILVFAETLEVFGSWISFRSKKQTYLIRKKNGLSILSSFSAAGGFRAPGGFVYTDKLV